jgi:hypothetical protein
VPLLYHELWENIKHDIKSMGKPNKLLSIDGHIEIQITNYVPQFTRAPHLSELSIPTTLIFGSYSFEIDLSFTQTFPKLGLYDIILINVGLSHERHNFFAVVVDVEDHWPLTDSVADRNLTNCNDNKDIIKVKSDLVLYASEECSNTVKKHCGTSRSQTISVVKLTNITSSRRQISAIYNLRTFSKQKSLLKPLNTDPYFLHEDILNVPAVALGNFNTAQMRVITYATSMFDNNTNDRLHLVHGPPGFLSFLSKISCKISELCYVQVLEKVKQLPVLSRHFCHGWTTIEKSYFVHHRTTHVMSCRSES